MKNSLYKGLTFILAFLFIIIACRKSEDPAEVAKPEPPPPVAPPPGKVPGVLDYGASIIYEKWSPDNDHIIKPKDLAVNGKYISWPEGLVIDEVTGIINIRLSQHGIRFTIGFIDLSINDTSLIELTISGLNYRSGIYTLSNNDTLAVPYYNETISLGSLLGLSNDNDYPDNPDGNGGGNDKAEFDDGHDDDNGNGYDDEPQLGQRANDQKVRVRTTNGVINLKKSLLDGAFGPNPQNGASKEVTIYYRINDNSNRALQSINIKLIYYKYKSDIPAEVLNAIQAQMRQDDARTSQSREYYSSKPRPPQIFVTRYSEEKTTTY
jgi:hypothetical protein